MLFYFADYCLYLQTFSCARTIGKGHNYTLTHGDSLPYANEAMCQFVYFRLFQKTPGTPREVISAAIFGGRFNIQHHHSYFVPNAISSFSDKSHWQGPVTQYLKNHRF